MAKILVADDNSNVQKTVTLALANLGIEVLSVNNGEAAVRKLADFAPDLVLADIFMPVRNGYEVCDYVKKDSHFAHVPVVLLVGAFDPLDEREAQRVGADGILKKPFVPPDPLITMVKMLLDRTMGDRLVEVAASKSAAASRAKTGGSVVAEEPPPGSDDVGSSDFSRSTGRVSFGEGERPVAFSQLLETPEQQAAAPETGLVEPVDDEQILTSSRDATLGDPIFWRNDEPESEPVPVADEELGDDSSLGISSWKEGNDSESQPEDSLLFQPIEPLESLQQMEPSEPLELIREDLHESQDESSQTVVEPGSILLDPASQSPLTVESDTAKELAANPIEWMATAPVEPSLKGSTEESEEHSQELTVKDSDGTPATTAPWKESTQDATDTIDFSHLGESSEDERVSAPLLTPEPDPILARVPEPASDPVKPVVIPEIPVSVSPNIAPDHAAEISAVTTGATPVVKSEMAPELEPDLTHDVAPHASEVPSGVTTDVTFGVPAGTISGVASGVTSGAISSGPSSVPSNPISDVFSLKSAARSPAAIDSETKLAEPTPDPSNTQPSIRPPAQSPQDTARSLPKRDWTDLTASIQSRANELVAQKISVISEFAATTPAVPTGNSQPLSVSQVAGSSSPDPALVEAVVQRVLDKMRPQVVDIITKEFLRPIVQALVHREIEKR